MGHLVRLQDAYRERGLLVIGVTDAPAADAAAFAAAHGVSYWLLAEAAADRARYGVAMIWGNQLFLVDPEGRIVAEGPAAVDAHLGSLPPPRASAGAAATNSGA